METKLNTVNMTAWVHKECDIMDEDALLRLQGAWETPEQKDEERELFIGTRFSNLYTAVDTPAEAANV